MLQKEISNIKRRIVELYQEFREAEELSQEIDDRVAVLKPLSGKSLVFKQDERMVQLQLKLEFIIKALTLATTGNSLHWDKPTVAETNQGVILAQEICQEMLELAINLSNNVYH